MGNVERRWSGQVQETIDGLGFIGRNPDDSPNVFIATGDSGMGMTHGTIAGILLTDLIQGRENAWARFYDPSRSAKGPLREFVRENANVALQYLDWASPGDITDPAVIPPGSGAVDSPRRNQAGTLTVTKTAGYMPSRPSVLTSAASSPGTPRQQPGTVPVMARDSIVWERSCRDRPTGDFIRSMSPRRAFHPRPKPKPLDTSHQQFYA